MSTFTELAETKTTVTIVPKRSDASLMLSRVSNFAFVGLLVYISMGSMWWTLVTGSIFIFYAYVMLKKALGEVSKSFNTIDEAIEYLEKEKEKE